MLGLKLATLTTQLYTGGTLSTKSKHVPGGVIRHAHVQSMPHPLEEPHTLEERGYGECWLGTSANFLLFM